MCHIISTGYLSGFENDASSFLLYSQLKVSVNCLSYLVSEPSYKHSHGATMSKLIDFKV